VNADTLASWFIPALAELLKKHPIELNLQVVDETNTQALLKRGEVYAALSTDSSSINGCKVAAIGCVDYILCASPNFIKQYFPLGLNVASLQRAPGVEFDYRDTMHSDYIEQHYGVRAGAYPRHKLRSSEAFVSMALEGVAYCLLPHFQAIPYLNSGQLIDLAPNQHLPRSLYWHSWILEKGLHKNISSAIVNYGKKLLSKSNATMRNTL
jgi:LysR family transcriptional regulator (chromosome initiation inhibitor)